MNWAFSSMGAPLKSIVVGGFAAGLLDILYAFASGAARGHSPDSILKYVASGLLGPAALSGGTATALAGLAMHFAMALLIAAIFIIAAEKDATAIRDYPWLSGPLFGVGVYLVMQQVVLPLSRVPLPSPRPPINFPDLAAHMFLVGLPIALAAGRWGLPARND